MKKHLQFLVVLFLTTFISVPALPQQTPSFIDITGVTVSGGNLTKIGSTAWGTGGAASTKSLDYVSDGYVEATATETNTNRAFGLSKRNIDASLGTIDFAIMLNANGLVYVYEKGTSRFTSNITYNTGDVFRVERFGYQIKYSKNGSVIYTSTLQSTSRLVADIALKENGSSLNQITLSNGFVNQASNTNPNGAGASQTVDWVDIDNMAFIGTRAIKSGPDGFGTGGLATAKRLDYATDGWIEATITETNTARFIGLSDQNMGNGYTGIDFSIYLATDRKIYIYENGTNRYSSGIVFNTGDVVRIERFGTQIQYKHNGNRIYTSSLKSFSRLIGDLAFNHQGATLDQIKISGTFSTPQASNSDPNGPGATQTVAWTNIDNMAFIGTKMVKTGVNGFGTGGLASAKRLDFVTDGWVEATADENNTGKMFGLSDQDMGAGYNGIDYAIYLASDRKIYVYENGTSRLSSGIVYNSGDVLRVERSGLRIVYKHQGNVIYTSSAQSNIPLIADFAFSEAGATLNHVKVSDSFTDPQPSNTDPNGTGVIQNVDWNNVDNMAFIGSKVVKFGQGGWDAGGLSSAKRLDFVTDGWMEVTANENNTAKMFGLSDQDQGTHYNTIDHAIYLASDRLIRIYENGESRHSSGITYNPGDVLRVERIGTKIVYKHKGNIIYTSAVQSTGPLVADLSFSTTGASLDDIKISNSFKEVAPSNTDPNASGVLQTVDWVNVDNMAFIGSKVVKVGQGGWDAGGLSSAKRLDFVTDGWMEVTANENNTAKMFGLSDQDQGTHYNTIDHAIYLASDKLIRIYENGESRYSSGITYNPGDVLRVERIGTKIVYKHKGDIIFTSAVQSTGPLVADLSFSNTGTSLDNIKVSSSFKEVAPSNTDPSADDVIQTVDWINVDNMAFIGSKIVKTGQGGWNTGGLSSAKRLDYVTDGWVEATANESSTAKMFGLSDQDQGTDYKSIDHAIYLASDRLVRVYENGESVHSSGLIYNPGDVLRVERVGTKIVYKHKGDIFFTSGVQSTEPLVADFSFSNTGASLGEVQISSTFALVQASNTDPNGSGAIQQVDWVGIDNVAFIGTKIVKTGQAGWETGGLASAKELERSVDGWVEVTANENATSKMFGLSEQDMGPGYTSIDFAIHMGSDRKIRIYESGTYKHGSGVIYNPGDKLRVERVGSKIKYYHKNDLIYTSATQSISKLVADLAFSHTGSTLDQVTISPSFATPGTLNTAQNAPGVIQSVEWKDVDNLAFIGSKIIKTAPDGWGTGGAASVNTLHYLEDGWVQAKITETNTSRMIGLSETNDGASYLTIDFALHLGSDRKIRVYESGTFKHRLEVNFNTGDLVKVARVGSKIEYSHNDDVFYTSSQASTSPLLADFAISHESGTLGEVTLSSSFGAPETVSNNPNAPGVYQNINWTDIDGLGFIDTKIVKVATDGWASGAAISTDFIPADSSGYIEVVASETNSTRYIGLSEQNQGNGYTTIDYGLQISSNGRLYVFENGTSRLNPNPPYKTGDILRVERSGNTIFYKQNSIVIYTSTIPSTTQLVADIALYHEGATLNNLRLSETADPVPVAGLSGSGGGHWFKRSNTIYSLDSIAIGQNQAHTDHLLSINGKMISKGVKVLLSGWADYVFENDYDLRSLEELKAYIEKHGHLPEIPSTKEVMDDGIYLGEMNKKLLQKIEELTLYLLDQEKKIKDLQKTVGTREDQ